MTLNHNYGCFSGVGGIAGNGKALAAVAAIHAQMINKNMKPNRYMPFNTCTQAAIEPMQCCAHVHKKAFSNPKKP